MLVAGVGRPRVRQPARRGGPPQPAERHRDRGHPDRGRVLRPPLARPRPAAGPPLVPAARRRTSWWRWASGWSPCSCWWLAGFGPSGAAVGILIGEVVAAARTRWAAVRVWSAVWCARCGPPHGWVAAVRPDPVSAAAARPSGARSCSTWWWPRCRSPWSRCSRTSMCSSSGATTPPTAAPTPRCRSPARRSSSARSCSAATSLPEAAIRWRQGGHALRQLAVVLVLLGVPRCCCSGLTLAAPQLLLELVFHHAVHVGLRRARTARRGHDHAERLGRADHVPVGRRAPLGVRRARGRCRRHSPLPCSGCTGHPGRRRSWTSPCRRSCWR